MPSVMYLRKVRSTLFLDARMILRFFSERSRGSRKDCNAVRSTASRFSSGARRRLSNGIHGEGSEEGRRVSMSIIRMGEIDLPVAFVYYP